MMVFSGGLFVLVRTRILERNLIWQSVVPGADVRTKTYREASMPERVALRSYPWRRRCWHIPALNGLNARPESDVATVKQGSAVDTPVGDFENSALLMQVTKLIAVRSIVYGSSNKFLNHVEEKSKFMLNYQTAQATVSNCDIPTCTCESSSSTSFLFKNHHSQ